MQPALKQKKVTFRKQDIDIEKSNGIFRKCASILQNVSLLYA